MLIPTLHFQTYILKIPKTKTSLQFSLPSDPGAFPSICDEIYVDNVRLVPLDLSHAGICRVVGVSENPGEGASSIVVGIMCPPPLPALVEMGLIICQDKGGWGV